MVELTVHDVLWSREHGHPVLVMSAAGKAAGAISIVLSPGDAQLLAVNPVGASVERSRLFGLIEGLVRALSARFSDVRFRLDSGMVLTAELSFECGLRTVTVPANFADGVVLALRAKVPMHISNQDLRWIRAVQETSPVQQSDLDPGPAISSFIESLRLDDLHGPSQDGR